MIPPVPPGQPNRLTLARRFTVGELLSDELVARGWTPTQLAVACRLPQGTIDGVIAGTVVITPEIAEQIGLGLGTSAGMWIALGALGPHSRSSLKNKGDTQGWLGRMLRLRFPLLNSWRGVVTRVLPQTGAVLMIHAGRLRLKIRILLIANTLKKC